ncbi:MAG: rane protein [Cereibacter sp.]|jgi:hypothetical protein|nr:rane protein [Cereibacter sp.]
MDRLWETIRANRRHALRVGLQTAAAVLCVHLVMQRLAPEQQSWAVLSALLTIGASADATLRAGLGRIGGALIGAALGLICVALLGSSTLAALLVASVLGNAVGAIRGSLGYAAVLAAIIALDPTPEGGMALSLAGAIVFGSVAGSLASLIVWPVFGRDRAALSLQRALRDCRSFLTLIEHGVGAGDRANREKVNLSFRRNITDLRDRIVETRFTASLPSGVGLHRAAESAEAFWYALVVLDRVVSAERQDLPDGAVEQLQPVLTRLSAEANRIVGALPTVTAPGKGKPISPEPLREAAGAARDRVWSLTACSARQDRALQALIFALNEIEESLLKLLQVMQPEGEGAPGLRPATA